jgi:hypothetical protein
MHQSTYVRKGTAFRAFAVTKQQATLRLKHLGWICLLLLLPLTTAAQVRRVVLVKLDGVPYEEVDKFVRQRDPRTGKSQLPWIEHIFYEHGTRLKNFYVRGLSLSAPSWSLLETGQHLQIKGNVEFDRYTLHTYDYLNFIFYVVNTSRGTRVDMPGVEVLDSIGEPLLIDAFAHDERYLTFSLFQRGPRFSTYQKSLENRLKRAPRELFDEWTMGFGMREALPDQLVREMIEKLDDPKVKYVDVVLTHYDHAAHHNNDAASHLVALKQLDNVFGHVWTAIQNSSLADETVLIAVSDHGFNSDARVYSQGYNLVKLLGSVPGGGHHVITKRRLMLDYSIKGINPFISQITTTTPDSFYLKGQSSAYPTALVDFDGNERASIHLRDSDLNLLHILLQQLQRGDLSPAVRKAATEAFFATLERRRPGWQRTADELAEELAALRRAIERQRAIWEQRPKKLTKEEIAQGQDDATKRLYVKLDRWVGQDREYTEYLRVLTNLLFLRPETFAPEKQKIEEVIGKGAMGDRNSIYQLQNYIVGPASSGLQLNPDGSLDMKRSFERVDYFTLLQNISVRNNVQPNLSTRPVDMVALRIPSRQLPMLNERHLTPDVIWVYGGPDKQALILAREDELGQLSFRYQPIRNLTQDEQGEIHFEAVRWQTDLPLRMFEDPKLGIAPENRERWLSQWHSEVEWFRAIHLTHYSNGLIGLYEELAQHAITRGAEDTTASRDQFLLHRLLKRQRALIETDMLIVANDHWNFDVRGFNPGGNHGSFFRSSTHSTLMFAGGKRTPVPQKYVIEEPYDSLSFVPTVLALTDNLRDDSNPTPILWDKGFRRFPGRVIHELMPKLPPDQKIADTGATTAP